MVHIDTDTKTEPKVVRLHVRGQLDLAAAEAFTLALTGASRLGRPVELDLSRVDFLDGCGLSMLIDTANRARLAGRELSISDASRCVRRLIEITETGEALAPLQISAQSPDKKAFAHSEHRRPGSSSGRWAFTR